MWLADLQSQADKLNLTRGGSFLQRLTSAFSEGRLQNRTGLNWYSMIGGNTIKWVLLTFEFGPREDTEVLERSPHGPPGGEHAALLRKTQAKIELEPAAAIAAVVAVAHWPELDWMELFHVL